MQYSKRSSSYPTETSTEVNNDSRFHGGAILYILSTEPYVTVSHEFTTKVLHELFVKVVSVATSETPALCPVGGAVFVR